MNNENELNDGAQTGDVGKWMNRIKSAVKFDESARKQYAIDRRYARGDSGESVTANLVGTYVDITASFLAAKQPDVDVYPARSVEPPSLDALRDMSEDIVRQKPEIQQAATATLQAATAMEDPNAVAIAQQTVDAMVEKEIRAEYDALRKKFSSRQRDAKVFTETMELVISSLWSKANIKRRINQTTRSALTISVGWIKASWQETTGMDSPMTTQRLNGLKDNIARIKAKQVKLSEENYEYSAQDSDEAAEIADLERQIAAVQAEAESQKSQGFVADCTKAEDIVVAKGVPLVDYLTAPWIAHKIPLPIDDAKAMCPNIADWSKATRFYPRTPIGIQNSNEGLMQSTVGIDDAETFTKSNGVNAEAPDADCWVMAWEIWDKGSNHVLTAIEGITSQWAKEPAIPAPTTRFYPFFLTPIGIIDNERHPQSLVTRTIKLIDEYNRIGSAEAEHRRRIRPKMIFNAGALAAGQMEKLMSAGTVEYVGVELTSPEADIRTIFAPMAYPQMDASLYNRQPIITELERVWAVQEALGGSVSVAKTATEADIQQQGFSSRTSDKREAIEDMMTELAQYTGELALTHLNADEVRVIAGEDSLWPKITKPEDIEMMCRISIRAGSTGKPNTQLERQSWGILLPQLTNAVMQIGQLRQADQSDLADKLEDLVRLTAERNGERLDIDSLMPQASTTPQPMMPADPTAPPAAPAGQLPPMP
jgi:hypothetical protein